MDQGMLDWPDGRWKGLEGVKSSSFEGRNGILGN
jgi:hypothetical protein